MNDFANKIKSVLRGDVDNSPETLDKYSRDASLFEIKPKLVVFPKDAEDIGNLVKIVNEENQKGSHWSLTPRAAGTDMTGGPLTESIVVEFTRYMNRIREIGADYAIAEPGVLYRDFEKETLKHNLLLPSYPASRELCAIGGIVANNSGGEKTLKYGKTEDYIEEIKMVLRDGNEYVFRALSAGEWEQKKELNNLEGEIYRNLSEVIEKNYDLINRAKPQVSKNSSGYYLWNVWDKNKKVFNLAKLIVGSQGTLGIITEVKLRLIRPSAHSRLLVVFLKDLKILAEIINHILVFKPESFESYDDHTLKIALKILPDIIKRLKGNVFILGFKFLPELWSLISGGMPKLVLLAEFTAESGKEAEEQAKKAEESLKEFKVKTRVARSEADSQKYWVIRRESFNLLRHHVHGMRTAPFIDDIIVRPEQLPEFLPRLDGILSHYEIIYTIAGHAGDANFHIIPLMDMRRPEARKIILEISEKVYDLVAEFKGSITAEHNDGLIRSPYLEKMYGPEICRLFLQTKKIFDPENIFNPGKKVMSSLEYAMGHLNRKVS